MQKLNRRHFLRGAGGATLSIPFLSSLIRDAKAQNSMVPKNFVALGTWHGGVWGSRMYPDAALLTDTMSYAGRTIRFGDLATTTQNGNNYLCDVLQAPTSLLTNNLLSKINVLRGLDIPYYLGHHAGGHLGNVGENALGSGIAGEMSNLKIPTIDQVLAWSPSFYSDTSNVAARSIAIGSSGMSCGYASPSTQTGKVSALPTEKNNLKLFNRIFYPERSSHGNNQLIVDRVLDMANSVRNNSRISARDKMRLDQHMERVYEVERLLSVTAPCTPVDPQMDSDEIYFGRHEFIHNVDDQSEYAGLLNDIIVAALACGNTRIATILQYYQFTWDVIGNWHLEVAHAATSNAGAQTVMQQHKQWFFEHVFLDLASKMEATPSTNGTVLDHTLLVWSQEAGQITHNTDSIPIITAGGAGGSFQTGMFVDYRNQNVDYGSTSNTQTEHPGLLYNQWLATILQSMGLSPNEYEIGLDINTGAPVAGYGMHTIASNKLADYVEAESVMGESLPIIT